MDHISYQSFNPLQNLKGFVLSRPPVLVFLICLITFAVTALSLAYFVRTSELKDPDVQLDWNILLEKLANLHFCLPHNKSNEKPAAAFDSGRFEDEKSDFSVKNNAQIDANNSISILVDLQFGREIENVKSNVTQVAGVVCGHFLGLKGEFASNEYHVSFDLPLNRKFNECEGENDCRISRNVCVTFYGLPVVPDVQKMKKCSLPDLTSSILINSANISVPRCSVLEEPEFSCQGDELRVFYTNNPDWSVMLSEHDRILINFHLMYTSYFLLLMVMTLLCYAVIRGRPKTKIFSPEKVHFDN